MGTGLIVSIVMFAVGWVIYELKKNSVGLIRYLIIAAGLTLMVLGLFGFLVSITPK